MDNLFGFEAENQFENLGCLNFENQLQLIEELENDEPTCSTPRGMSKEFDWVEVKEETDLKPTKPQKEEQTCFRGEEIQKEQNKNIKKEEAKETPQYLVNKKEGIYNRSMLRMIRKYFLNLFKAHNKRLVRRRFTKVRPFELLRGAKDLCEKLFPTHSESDLPNFIVRLFSEKYKGLKPAKNEAEERGDILSSCASDYSITKFEKIHKFEEFKILFRHLYEHTEGSERVIDKIFKTEKGKISKDPKTYAEVFEKMYKKCLQDN